MALATNVNLVYLTFSSVLPEQEQKTQSVIQLEFLGFNCVQWFPLPFFSFFFNVSILIVCSGVIVYFICTVFSFSFFFFFNLLPGAIIQIMHRCERQTGAFKRTDARKEGEGGTDTRDARQWVGRNWSRTRWNGTGVAGLSGGQEMESSSNCSWTGPGQRPGRSGPGVAPWDTGGDGCPNTHGRAQEGVDV